MLTMEFLFAMCKVPILVDIVPKINYCKFSEILANLGICAITIILRNNGHPRLPPVAIFCKHGPPSTNQKS